MRAKDENVPLLLQLNFAFAFGNQGIYKYITLPSKYKTKKHKKKMSFLEFILLTIFQTCFSTPFLFA